jgi:hypothetical protein
MGQKYGADKADPGAVGALQKEPRPKKRKRKIPTNVKGLKKKPRKG